MKKPDILLRKVWVGMLLWCALSVAQAQAAEPIAEAVQAIFHALPPKHFIVYQGGTLPEGQGQYVVMRNTQNNILALVIRSEPSSQPEGRIEPLCWDDVRTLGLRLFERYVGCGTVATLEPFVHRHLRNRSHRLPLYGVRVAFADGFVEPDVITRILAGQNHQYTLMLGLPTDGKVGSSDYFISQYRQMTRESQRVFDALKI